VFDRFFASRGRRRALEVLNLKPGERVLLVGIGTGADLPLLPEGIWAYGIDLSQEMLSRAQAKLPSLKYKVALVRGDAHFLPLHTGTFDCAILNLILSVVPNGTICLHETIRAIRLGGRVVVFDKFMPDKRQLPLGRRLLNLFTTLIGTDITRRLSDLMTGIQCVKTHDEPSLLNGAYRIILLDKITEG
jgi:ubiquinone/menaquinone biosynthesis C-methylase UbiE